MARHPAPNFHHGRSCRSTGSKWVWKMVEESILTNGIKTAVFPKRSKSFIVSVWAHKVNNYYFKTLEIFILYSTFVCCVLLYPEFVRLRWIIDYISGAEKGDRPRGVHRPKPHEKLHSWHYSLGHVHHKQQPNSTFEGKNIYFYTCFVYMEYWVSQK